MKKQTMKRVVALAAAISMVIGLTACSNGGGDAKETTKAADNKEQQESNTSGEINIGVVGPMTGANAEDGIGFKVAVGIAVDEINAAGGAAGYKLTYDSNDSASDANQSADIVRQYAENDKYSVIIGDFTTSCCVVDAEIVDKYQIPMITPTASGSQLPGISDWFFSMSHTQEYESPWAAEHVTKDYLGAKSVGIMYLNTDWGTQVDGFLLKAYEELGVEVLANESYLDTETNFSSIVSKLSSEKPDVIVVVDQSNAATIINQIRSAGVETQIQLLGPGAAVQIVDQTGDNSEGVVTNTASLLTYDNEKVSGFMKTFYEQAGFDAADHAICAYNTVYMIATAIENAVADGKTEINRTVIKDYLETAEFDSPIGLVKFNELHGSNRDMLVVAVENGEYVVKCDYGYFD